nr:hypothetical protein BaRGS_023256 [Batillaria attramentaria]
MLVVALQTPANADRRSLGQERGARCTVAMTTAALPCTVPMTMRVVRKPPHRDALPTDTSASPHPAQLLPTNLQGAPSLRYVTLGGRHGVSHPDDDDQSCKHVDRGRQARGDRSVG